MRARARRAAVPLLALALFAGCAAERQDEAGPRALRTDAPEGTASPDGTTPADDARARVAPSPETAAALLAGAPLPSLAPILEAATPAVVNVSTLSAARRSPLMDDPFYRRFGPDGGGRGGRGGAPRSAGSGVIVDAAAGLVVTNDHVIDGAGGIVVTLADGRELPAELVGTDPEADVAVLRVAAEGLTALPWADSDALRVGDFSIAIGNPFGLGQTVTSGIVSALGRSGLGIERFEDFIQTDASINPGNSGGALIGLDGRLIGINTAIVGPAGGNVGIGFAIPANLARDIVEQLVEYGEVRRGALGIVARALDPRDAERLGASRGVLIDAVTGGSPADEAGLRPGDVVVAIGGRRVDDVAEVRNRIGLVRRGQRLALSVVRGGEALELEAVVDVLPAAGPLLEGVRLREARTRAGRPVVAIDALEPDSPLARAGLEPGDAILAVEGAELSGLAALEALASREPRALTLDVLRGRRVVRVRVRVAAG